MKKCVLALLLFLLLQGTALAADIPREVLDALPRAAAELLEDADLSPGIGLWDSVERVLCSVEEQVKTVLRQRIRGIAEVLLVVVLCGAVEGFSQDALKRSPPFLNMAGGITITLLTAGSLDSLIGLGTETIRQLHDFSEALLPALAAAAAAGGMVSGAAVQQMSAVLCVDLLLSLIHNWLLPGLYVYIGVLTASTCLGEARLQLLAKGLKRAITWVLTTALAAFTLYLSIVRIVSGTADGMAVKMTKTVISGVVPVVGGIISEAAETLLAGAGMLRQTIGLFGLLGILAVCLWPFVQLGVQYLLYKGAAFAAEIVGVQDLYKLIDGLGGAFGLMLGMTGACGLLMLVSVLAAAMTLL